MKKLMLILFIIFHYHIYGAKIIFDLGGVLLKQVSISVMPTIIYNLGVYNCINYCIHNGFAMPHDRIFEFADLVFQQKDACNFWLESKMSCADFYCRLANAIDQKEYWYFFKNSSERKMIKAGIIYLLPNNLTRITTINSQGEKIVKKCIKEGHEVYILSNWDKESIDTISCKCSRLFNLFPEENIYISGRLGIAKPDEEIFRKVIKDDDPKEFYFMDDSEENIQAAKKAGMNVIHYKGYESTIVKLKDHGILKRKFFNF